MHPVLPKGAVCPKYRRVDPRGIDEYEIRQLPSGSRLEHREGALLVRIVCSPSQLAGLIP
jgi:hypothetical protein